MLLFALAWAPSASAQTAAAVGTQWALLVGVDDYENPEVTDLRFTVRDVNAFGEALVNTAKFPAPQVVRLTTGGGASSSKPTQAALLAQLDRLAAKVGPDDTFLFYFSGHGFSRGADRSFLGTVEANPITAAALERSALPLTVLQARLARIRARRVVFVVDACRNDPLRGKGDVGNVMTRQFSRDLIRVAKSTAGGLAGSAVLFACSEGERAWEWPEKQHGSFTYYLLEGLRGGAADDRGEVTVNGLADYVQTRVVQWATERDREQTPDLRQDGAARLVLARGLINPVAPVQADEAQAFHALGKLQRLVREYGFQRLVPPGGAGFRLFMAEGCLTLAVRSTLPEDQPLPDRAVRTMSAPVALLDTGRMTVHPGPHGRNFAVSVPIKGDQAEVEYTTKEGETLRSTFSLWFSEEAVAREAAGLLRDVVTRSAPGLVVDLTDLRRGRAVRGLQTLLRDHGASGVRGLPVERFVLSRTGDRLLLTIRYEDPGSVPGDAVTRWSVPIGALDPEDVRANPFRSIHAVEAGTRRGSERVTGVTRDGEVKRPRFMLFFKDAAAASRAAELMKELAAAR